MENPIKMDDLGVPLFLETPICLNVVLFVVVLKVCCFLSNHGLEMGVNIDFLKFLALKMI